MVSVHGILRGGIGGADAVARYGAAYFMTFGGEYAVVQRRADPADHIIRA
jgi:hypothetical protein